MCVHPCATTTHYACMYKVLCSMCPWVIATHKMLPARSKHPSPIFGSKWCKHPWAFTRHITVPRLWMAKERQMIVRKTKTKFRKLNEDSNGHIQATIAAPFEQWLRETSTEENWSAVLSNNTADLLGNQPICTWRKYLDLEKIFYLQIGRLPNVNILCNGNCWNAFLA